MAVRGSGKQPAGSAASLARLVESVRTCSLVNASFVRSLAALLLLDAGRKGDAAELLTDVSRRGAERDANWVCCDALVTASVSSGLPPDGAATLSAHARGACVLLRKRVTRLLKDT
jgi:hypothetical protein